MAKPIIGIKLIAASEKTIVSKIWIFVILFAPVSLLSLYKMYN